MWPSDTGPLLKSAWVALCGAHTRATFATHFSVFRSSPVVRGRLNPPAEMPGPTHKQKIVRAFFQKRAIELQTAGMARRPPLARPPTNPIGSYKDGEKVLTELKQRTTTVVTPSTQSTMGFPGILTSSVDAHF